MNNRKFWVFYNPDGTASLVIDFDQVAAINVPDSDKPGAVILLKTGMSITCSEWSKETREKNIKFFLKQTTGT